jgi:hypothetical protein
LEDAVRIRYGTMSGLCALLLAVQVGSAGAQDAAPQTLSTNVHVFDRVNEARIENASDLIEGNLIRTISTDAIEAEDATMRDDGLPSTGIPHVLVNGTAGSKSPRRWTMSSPANRSTPRVRGLNVELNDRRRCVAGGQ